MNTTRITSRHNPLLSQFRLAASGSRRLPPDLVLCEGLRALEEAAASAFETVAVLMDETFGTDERASRLVEQWRRDRTRSHRVPEKVLKSLSEVLTPQGAVALVRVPTCSVSQARWPADPLIVCADALQDPGNLGSLIRAAAAAGATAVCCTPRTVSPRNPKCLRASAGTYFRIPVIEDVSPGELVERCRCDGIQIYRTDSHGGTHYREVDLRNGVLLVLGNEGRGLDEAAWPSVPSIRIPLASGVESLNVAAAGAILLFEALDQRTVRRGNRSSAEREG
jgi:RNA methyltransferase, TrmH family